MTRCAAISDTHCGHALGLAPQAWWVSRARNPALRRAQEALWRHWCEALEMLRPPVDVALVLGDLVEGPQEIWRGVELLEPDVLVQCEMAAEILKMLEARTVYIVRGSPYHAGMAEEYEDVVARKLGARIANEIMVKVEKVWFHLAHFVGRSNIPHGRATPLAREWVLGMLMAAAQALPKAQVILRGHVHYHAYAGGTGWLSMSLPALCLGSGKLARRTRGIVECGVVEFNVEGGDWTWHARVHPAVPEHGVMVVEHKESPS